MEAVVAVGHGRCGRRLELSGVGVTAALALCCLTACGGGDSPAPEPPAVDVTGSWRGPIESTDGRGNPVYGTYTVTFTLSQSGSNVTGGYRATDINLGGSVLWGVVSGSRLTLGLSTTECPGSLELTGTVRHTTGADEMDVVYSGTTACTGERQDKGTLVRAP